MAGVNQQKIGILGGTFNPIHTGHLMMAENAYEQFDLQKILFLPCGEPPHKDRLSFANTRHRANMVSMAIADNPHFELSLVEIDRPGVTYTCETLQALAREHADHEYFFILGADSLFTFEHWKNPEEICNLCTLLAATREDLAATEVDRQIDYLRGKYGGNIFRLNMPDFDISSKLIRERLKQGKTIKYMVPGQVEQYILEQNLYRGGHQNGSGNS